MRHIRLALMTVAVLGLMGCAEDEQVNAEVAVRWLNDYASRISETSEFRINPIRLEGQSKTIDMNVVITSVRMARDLRGRNRVHQFKILQQLCPPAHEEIWRLMGSELALRINITEGGEDIVTGSCLAR